MRARRALAIAQEQGATAHADPARRTSSVLLEWSTSGADACLQRSAAEWIAARIPGAPLSFEENAGHLLAEDAPARLLAEILYEPAHS